MNSTTRSMNYWAVLIAAIAAFVTSSFYHSTLLLGGVWRAVGPAAASTAFAPWTIQGTESLLMRRATTP